jgi:hypothetical protein
MTEEEQLAKINQKMMASRPTQQASPMMPTRQAPQASPMTAAQRRQGMEQQRMTARMVRKETMDQQRQLREQQQMNRRKEAAINGRPGNTTSPMREEPARYKPTPSVLPRQASTTPMTPQQQVAQNDAKQVAADQALTASMMAKGGVVKKPAGKTMMAKGGAVKKGKK